MKKALENAYRFFRPDAITSKHNLALLAETKKVLGVRVQSDALVKTHTGTANLTMIKIYSATGNLHAETLIRSHVFTCHMIFIRVSAPLQGLGLGRLLRIEAALLARYQNKFFWPSTLFTSGGARAFEKDPIIGLPEIKIPIARKTAQPIPDVPWELPKTTINRRW